jgi:glycosyltransferase involved in cell wall biosynthesis
MAAAGKRKRALMVAFHFPPDGGSGMQRTLKFARYLPELGWDVEVLTVRASTYDMLDYSMLEQIPEQVAVHRTFCLHPGKHLSIGGWYPGIFNFLDRFAYWYPFGVRKGRQVLRQRPFDVIYSTSPTRTAHLIAGTLAQSSGVPWVCDFRDPWLDPTSEPILRATLGGEARVGFLRARERNIVRRASRIIVNTAPSKQDLAARYTDLDPGRIEVLPNGYDEADFTGIAAAPRNVPGSCLLLLHSGEIYPVTRDPRPLIEAVAALVKNGRIGAQEIHLKFIGSGGALESSSFRGWLAERSMEKMVTLERRMAHGPCIAEMLAANALLLLQCTPEANMQVPAKFYEYLRTGKPMLTLAPAASATAQIASECRTGWVLDSHDAAGLQGALLAMIERHRRDALVSERPGATKYERKQLTARLAGILEQCSQGLGPAVEQEPEAAVSPG